MFIERSPTTNPRKGCIEVICGSMFSGKTEELIRRLNRAKIANQKVEIFKPIIDQRYHATDVVSHNATTIRATPIKHAQNLLLLSEGIEVVGIDEAQFLDTSLVDVVQHLASNGTRVVLAGLDMDFAGKPFGIMPQLMAVAEFVTKVNAICMVCNDIATHSFRKTHDNSTVVVGESNIYEARCRYCFNEGMKNRPST